MVIDFSEIRDVIYILAALAVVFGFYFNTRNKNKNQDDEIKFLKKRVGDVSKEMADIHKEQNVEIGIIKTEYNGIITSLAVMQEGQKNMQISLDDIKSSLKGNK